MSAENTEPWAAGQQVSARRLERMRTDIAAQSSPLTPGRTISEAAQADAQDRPARRGVPAIVTAIDTTNFQRVAWKEAGIDTGTDPVDEYIEVSQGLESQGTEKEWASIVGGAEGLDVDDPILVFPVFNSEDELMWVAMRDQPKIEWLRLLSHTGAGVYTFEIMEEDVDGVLTATGITGDTAREANLLTTIVVPINLMARFFGFELIGGVPKKKFTFNCCGPFGSASGGF